jgi:hypothetical protein
MANSWICSLDLVKALRVVKLADEMGIEPRVDSIASGSSGPGGVYATVFYKCSRLDTLCERCDYKGLRVEFIC